MGKFGPTPKQVSRAYTYMARWKSQNPGETPPNVIDRYGRTWDHVDAALVVNLFRSGGGYAAVLRLCGKPYWLDTLQALDVTDMQAWAVAYTLSREAKSALAAEVIRSIAARALNPTKLSDILTWKTGEDGKFTVTVKDSSALTEDEASAIEKLVVTKDGVRVELKDQDGPAALLARMTGLIAPSKDEVAPPGVPNDIRDIVEAAMARTRDLLAPPSEAGLRDITPVDAAATGAVSKPL